MCPSCSEPVDIRPVLKYLGFRNILPKGQGVRCQSCRRVLEVNQWYAIAASCLPFLVFIIPLFWIPTPTTKPVRFLIALFGVGPMLWFLFSPPISLYRLVDPGPHAKVKPDDEAFE